MDDSLHVFYYLWLTSIIKIPAFNFLIQNNLYILLKGWCNASLSLTLNEWPTDEGPRWYKDFEDLIVDLIGVLAHSNTCVQYLECRTLYKGTDLLKQLGSENKRIYSIPTSPTLLWTFIWLINKVQFTSCVPI